MTTLAACCLRWVPSGLRSGLAAAASSGAAANSYWLLLDRMVRAVVGLLVGAWVARHLGPSQFGSLAYALAFVALFQALATAGIESVVVRDIARDPRQSHQVLGAAFLVRGTAGVLCWLAAIGFAAALGGAPDRVLLTALVAGGLVFQAADVLDLWFQSHSQSKRTVMAKLAAHLLTSGIKIVLILHGAGVLAFAAVVAFEAAANAAALTLAFRRHGVRGRWTFDGRRAYELLAQSWPLMLSGVAIVIYMRIDQLMVSRLVGERELGLYAAVLPISQVWQALPMALGTSLAPLLARQRQSDAEGYRRSIVWTFRGFFYAGVTSAVATSLVARPLVRLLFGEAYETAAPVLAVHAVSNVFCFLGIAHSLWLTNEGILSVRLIGTVLASAVAVTLNLMLLPSLGLIGAAWSAVAAQAIAAFLVNAVLDRPGFRLQCAAIGFGRIRAS